MRFARLPRLSCRLSPPPLRPPGVPQKKLTIERIFASPPLRADAALLKLSPDGRYADAAATARRRPRALRPVGDRHQRPAQLRMLVEFDEDRRRRRSAKPRRCSASARASAARKGIVEYDWAPDGKSILVPLDGDLYLADVATGASGA